MGVLWGARAPRPPFPAPRRKPTAPLHSTDSPSLWRSAKDCGRGARAPQSTTSGSSRIQGDLDAESITPPAVHVGRRDPQAPLGAPLSEAAYSKVPIGDIGALSVEMRGLTWPPRLQSRRMPRLYWSNPLSDSDSFADVFVNWQPQLHSSLNRNGQSVTDGCLKFPSLLAAIDPDEEVCSVGKNRC